MLGSRADHRSLRLADGRILVVGGLESNGAGLAIGTEECYDPATDSWSPMPTMAFSRGGHSLNLLPTGRVLIAGGGNGWTVSTFVEVLDPVARLLGPATKHEAPSLGKHAATLLADGRLLVTGGALDLLYLSAVHLFDPTTDRWTSVAPMNEARGQHLTQRLQDGRVLVVGGVKNGEQSRVGSVEIYDPRADQWTLGPEALPIIGSRWVPWDPITASLASLILQDDGKVLIIGPFDQVLLDPATLAFSAVQTRPLMPASAGLGGNRFLVKGSDSKAAWLYDGTAGTWQRTGNMNHDYTYPHVRFLSLPGGKVLCAGNSISSTVYAAFTEVFDPKTGVWTDVAVPQGTVLPFYDYLYAPLPDGRILGLAATGQQRDWNALVFDPYLIRWKQAPLWMLGRSGGSTLTILADGRAMLFGGQWGSSTLAHPEYFY